MNVHTFVIKGRYFLIHLWHSSNALICVVQVLGLSLFGTAAIPTEFLSPGNDWWGSDHFLPNSLHFIIRPTVGCYGQHCKITHTQLMAH
jgi:hypothetical protein